jgi:integrase
LFTLLYNTGARISEALQLRAKDLRERSVCLHGKGRKDREVPLWVQTARRLHQWCKVNRVEPEQLVFTNRLGAPLSQDGVAFRLALSVRKATAQCPSLQGRRITSHTFRHSCAMALLQAGVALEVIALYLGHAKPITTHGYIEADLKMKADCLRRLTEPLTKSQKKRETPSRLLAFLEAI